MTHSDAPSAASGPTAGVTTQCSWRTEPTLARQVRHDRGQTGGVPTRHGESDGCIRATMVGNGLGTRTQRSKGGQCWGRTSGGKYGPGHRPRIPHVPGTSEGSGASEARPGIRRPTSRCSYFGSGSGRGPQRAVSLPRRLVTVPTSFGALRGSTTRLSDAYGVSDPRTAQVGLGRCETASTEEPSGGNLLARI